MGALPIVDTELKEAAESELNDENGTSQPNVIVRTKITADGTYATESVYTAPGDFPLTIINFYY